jgi:hypothetical protein
MNNPEGSGLGPGIFTDEQMNRYRKKETAEAVRRVEEQEAEKERAREAALQAERTESEKQIEAEKERMKENWIASGGTASEFERQWPTLREGIILERMFGRDEDRAERAASVRDIWRPA